MNKLDYKFWSDIVLVVFAASLVFIKWLEKREKNEIIEAYQIQGQKMARKFDDTIVLFQPHIERVRRSHGMLKELVNIHRDKDENGRPFVYVPKEFIETQKSILEIERIHANTQQQVLKLLEKFSDKFDRFSEKFEQHNSQCHNQFLQTHHKGE